MGLSNMQISGMLETAVVAARLAGQRAMEELRYIHTTIKNNVELVTHADPICQSLIISRIKENFPDHGFIAEEGSDGKMFRVAPRENQSFWWVIDPIDGTNNYAHSLLGFCVSIAAMYEGRPVVGVIFDPATESMFTAAADMDAQLNSSRINVSDENINEFASFAIDSHNDPATDKGVRQMMEQTRFRCLGSTALHLAYVAKGSLIGTATATARLWDFAAGALLVERAGGKITGIDGKELFPADMENYKGENFTILAANNKTSADLLKIFAQ